MQKKLEEMFEWFHRNPELSYEEYRTTEHIRQILTDAGVEILPLPLETGLVAVVRAVHTYFHITIQTESLKILLITEINTCLRVLLKLLHSF